MRTGTEPGRVRITYLIGSLDLGGAERQLVRLANNLNRDEFDPRILCLFTGGLLERDLRADIPCEALSLHRLDQTGPRLHGVLGARLLVALFKRINRDRPHILHAIMPSAYVLGGLTGWLARVPVIIAGRRALVSLHDFPRPQWRLAAGLANRAIDVHLCNSEAVRSWAIAKEGIDSRRTEVIYNAVQPDPADSPATLRPEWLPQQGGLRAAMIANLIDYKGHKVMLEAMAEVVRSHPDLRVVLFGEGPERASLERMVESLGLDANIVFAGSDAEAPRYLHLFDLALLTSFHEGFPNALMEAMAAGVPVVASRVGGVPELVREGTDGLLVPAGDPAALADAITRLVEHPIERSRLGRNARTRVEDDFSIGSLVKRTESLYRRTLESATGKLLATEA